jgi:hypothetical protein
MGTFAGTAIVDYRLYLPTKENKLPPSISVSSKQTETAAFRWFRLPSVWNSGNMEI